MRILLTLAVAALLSLPAVAGNVFVGNQPYEGRVVGLGDEVRLALFELAEALELEVEETAAGWTLGGVAVPTRVEQGEVWVDLSLLPESTVRVVRNRATNTIDLYRKGTVSKPAVDEWGGSGTVVYFYADWSLPCQDMEQSISMLEQSSTIKLARLNVDNPDSAVYRKYVSLFEGDRIPFFVLLNERGKKIDTFSGFLTYNELLAKLKAAYSK